MFLSYVILAFLVVGFLVAHSVTLYLDRSYTAAVSWLSLIVVCGLTVGLNAAFALAGVSDLLLAMLGFGTAGVFGLLLAAKLRLRDNWARSSRRLLRTLTDLDIPHDKFTVRTSDTDSVNIVGYHVHTAPNYALRPAVVILAHGGFRSKDIFAKALMAAWLSQNFDVVGFDFRGHGESGGEWTGDGKTVADLKAVVDFVRQKGYQKIGVYGRSMGGWTAVLEAADYHDVEAIAVAGMPPGFFSEVPEFRGRISGLRIPGAAFVMRVLLGVRFKHFDNDRRPIDELGKVSPVPILIIYNQTDPGAGVIGERGHWESIPLEQRESSYRHIHSLPFTMQEVFDAARDPKEKWILPGAEHVYSLNSIRDLLTQVEEWFIKHLS